MAQVSRQIVLDGSRACLFTDQANPTSNAMYTALDYRPVVDTADLTIARSNCCQASARGPSTGGGGVASSRLSSVYPAEREGGFVGRDHELKVLLAAARRVIDGVPKTVVLVGEAGIGKSRLVAELAARVSEEVTVLLGGAVDSRVGLPGIGAPFGPLVEAVRWAVDDRSDSGRLAAAWIDPGTPAQGADPVVARQGQLLRLLGVLAQERPVLLVVEDVHWADESSLAALVHLAAVSFGGLVIAGGPPHGCATALNI